MCNTCQGENCNNKEELKVYNVLDKGDEVTDWGNFTYCPKCAKVDEETGFTVVLK